MCVLRIHNLIGYYLEKNLHNLKIACFVNTCFLSFSFTCLQGITLLDIETSLASLAFSTDFKIPAHASVTACSSAMGLKQSPQACFLASAGEDLISHLTSSGVGDRSPSSTNEI